MDVWMLVFTGLAGVAAMASAVVAIAQAVKASTAEKRAETAQIAAEAARDESAAMAGKATAAFIRQAEALELSNKMKLDELRPPDWMVVHINNQLYGARNTSGRSILVDRIEVAPEDASGRVRFGLQPDGVYAPGDRVEFMHSRVNGRNAHKFTIFWRFIDAPDSGLNECIVPL